MATEFGDVLTGDVVMSVISFLDHAPCLCRALGGGGGGVDRGGGDGGAANLWRVSSRVRRYFSSEPFKQQLAEAKHKIAAAARVALHLAGWDNDNIMTAVMYRSELVRRHRASRSRLHTAAPLARADVCVLTRGRFCAQGGCSHLAFAVMNSEVTSRMTSQRHPGPMLI